MVEQVQVAWRNFSLKWKIIIILSFGFSIVSIGVDIFGVNISLFQIEKFGIFHTNTTEINQFQTFFEGRIGIKSEANEDRYNVEMSDDYGNRFFIENYTNREVTWNGECNNERTNCIVYSKYSLDNNEIKPRCYILESSTRWNSTLSTSHFEITDYALANPEKCIGK